VGAKEFTKVSPNVPEPRAVATGLLLPTDTFNKGPVATARGSVTTAHFSYLLLIGTLSLMTARRIQPVRAAAEIRGCLLTGYIRRVL